MESPKYFRPITHKKDAPEDKDPPEGKEYIAIAQSIWVILIKGYTIVIVIKCQL